MVRPDGYAKLLDFGLARAQPESIRHRPDACWELEHRGRPDPRHDGLYGARAGARRGGLGRSRRLLARRRDVRARHRPPSVHGSVTARNAECPAVGHAGAAVVDQLRAAARARSVDPRIAAEGSQASARGERGDVPAGAGTRLEHRNIAVVGGRRPAPAHRKSHRRRARGRADRAQSRVRARSSRQGAHGSRVGRGRRRQDNSRGGIRQRARGARRTSADRPGALLRTACRQRSLPASA